MSNTRSRHSMRVAGGSQVFTPYPDTRASDRFLFAIAGVGREALAAKIANFLATLERDPSIGNVYGLTKGDIDRLLKTWSANGGEDIPAADWKKMDEAIDKLIF